ncbi:hypothetical protein Q8F55_009157 [Vanrija albida]|uniref:TRIP4/RQT4 C2HC5-type zinc finger domain-containing protein n=1 Tax=Vanrija albida TaxID=181172 RepID=A0ABR3PSU0_9TREE
MAPTPAWVVKGLQDVLGLDAETIEQVIVPDLESSYSSEVRLRSHLQDFLGSSAPARAFADKYTQYRFPSIAASSRPQILTPDPDLVKKPKAKGTKSATGSGRATPAASSSSTNVADALEAAFGPGGKVYQKHQDNDLFPGRGGSGKGAHRSTPGSGAHTPRAGLVGSAITIHEAKSKPAPKGKGKDKEEKIWDLPKSKAVLRLEGQIANLKGLQAGMGKVALSDDYVPCFCQARVHPIAPYTPQCGACGLILCKLQPPHAPCPSCSRPTLTPPALSRLILRIQDEIVAQEAREQAERDEEDRLRKEKWIAETGGGAFPSLQGNGPKGKPSTAEAARKVLTIGGKNAKGKGRATITTTTYTSVPVASSSKPKEEAPAKPTDVIPRPRSPPLDTARAAKELSKILSWRDENDRPWGDPKAERRGDAWVYVEPPLLEVVGREGSGRRSKAKNKNIGLDGRKVVGAA